MNTRTVTTYYTNRDGNRFYARRCKVADPRAAVVISHGLGEHSGRYLPLIDYFADKGIAVLAYDQRGHGKSDGRQGDIDQFDSWVNDLRTFVWRAKRLSSEKIPVFVIGHSLGGLITLKFIKEFGSEIDGAIVSAPAITPTVELSPIKMWLGTRLAKVLPLIKVSAEINPQYLSRDSAAVLEYVNDPMVFNKVTLRLGNEILNTAQGSLTLADHISCPLLMLQAEGDRICSAESTRTFYERVSHPRKQLLMYAGDFHEPFTDVSRERVFEDIDNWIGKVMTEKDESSVVSKGVDLGAEMSKWNDFTSDPAQLTLPNE